MGLSVAEFLARGRARAARRRPPARTGFRGKQDLNITGLDELLKALQSLPKEVARQAIRKPLREGAKIVLAEAKRNVPKGKTGNLKRSLKVRAGKRKKGTISIRVVTSEGWFKGETYYGGFIEYGTGERFHKSGKSVGTVEARHFIKRAYDTTKDRVRKMMERAIVKNIDQAVRELKATS